MLCNHFISDKGRLGGVRVICHGREGFNGAAFTAKVIDDPKTIAEDVTKLHEVFGGNAAVALSLKENMPTVILGFICLNTVFTAVSFRFQFQTGKSAFAVVKLNLNGDQSSFAPVQHCLVTMEANGVSADSRGFHPSRHGIAGKPRDVKLHFKRIGFFPTAVEIQQDVIYVISGHVVIKERSLVLPMCADVEGVAPSKADDGLAAEDRRDALRRGIGPVVVIPTVKTRMGGAHEMIPFSVHHLMKLD